MSKSQFNAQSVMIKLARKINPKNPSGVIVSNYQSLCTVMANSTMRSVYGVRISNRKTGQYRYYAFMGLQPVPGAIGNTMTELRETLFLLLDKSQIRYDRTKMTSVHYQTGKVSLRVSK